MTDQVVAPAVVAASSKKTSSPSKVAMEGSAKKTSVKGKSTSASHPPYGQMVKKALASMKEKKGSSRPVINKYIIEQVPVKDHNPATCWVQPIIRPEWITFEILNGFDSVDTHFEALIATIRIQLISCSDSVHVEQENSKKEQWLIYWLIKLEIPLFFLWIILLDRD